MTTARCLGNSRGHTSASDRDLVLFVRVQLRPQARAAQGVGKSANYAES
jgi:hypothetical protein